MKIKNYKFFVELPVRFPFGMTDWTKDNTRQDHNSYNNNQHGTSKHKHQITNGNVNKNTKSNM